MAARVTHLGWLACGLAACASLTVGRGGSTPPPGLAHSGVRIDPNALLDHIQVLASDAFEGRRPGTPGGDRTEAWLVEQLQALGLRPGNPDGTYLQAVPLVAVTSHASFSLRLGKQVYVLSPDDFSARSEREGDVELNDSPVIFVGTGTVAPEYHWDDFKGVDVGGSTVLTFPNEPQVADPQDHNRLDDDSFEGRSATRFTFAGAKDEAAEKRGAAARFTVAGPGPYGLPGWKDRLQVDRSEHLYLRDPEGGFHRPAVVGELSPTATQTLFRACGIDMATAARVSTREFRPVALNAFATIHVRSEVRPVTAHNVVALLPGSDPALGAEAVVYSAHWDHLGRLESAHPGAVDNASGVSAVLEIARAFVHLQPPPRRTILFLLTTGEESGLLGSRYYVDHPVIPLSRTVAEINFDIVNVWGPTRDVRVAGPGQDALTERLAVLAEERGRELLGDPQPEAGDFYRSDHYPFAEKGIPALFLVPGMELRSGGPNEGAIDYSVHRYHQPSDRVLGTWDLTGGAEDAELGLELGYQVAQAKDRPAKPGAPTRGGDAGP